MTPETIARSLTPAQREAILSGGYNDDFTLRGGQRAMFYKMKADGIFGDFDPMKRPRARWDFGLTPLGLAVRAALTNEGSTDAAS